MGNVKSQNERAVAERDQPLATLDDITNRIRNVADHFGTTLARLDAFGDRAFGPRPEDTEGSNGPFPVVDGAVDQVYVALNRLDNIAVRLAASQDRINDLA